MNETDVQVLKGEMDRILADLVKDLFLGGPMLPLFPYFPHATSCSSGRDEGNLTVSQLRRTLDALRSSRLNALISLGDMRMNESVHCTVSQAKWVRVRRSWRSRLYGGRLPLRLWRAAVMLSVLLFAALVSGWFLLALPILSLRPHRWRVARRPCKIYEQVPDPNYYIVSGVIVAHPITMERLRVELVKRKV